MPKVYRMDGVTPVVDPTAFVHPTAVLTGDVVVGADCYVGPGASLRGDMGRIVVKRGSSFQDNCVAHSFTAREVIIGENANVGHGAVLHGCTLGDYALVGMNAVVMDGAEIGECAFVAALALVPSAFKVPPRTVVAGIPAKVLRPLTADEIAWKRDVDVDYQVLCKRAHAAMELVEALTEPPGDELRMRVDGALPYHEVRKS